MSSFIAFFGVLAQMSCVTEKICFVFLIPGNKSDHSRWSTEGHLQDYESPVFKYSNNEDGNKNCV